MTMRLRWLLFLFLLLTSVAIAETQSTFRIAQAGSLTRQYFPGDFVHLIVEAPVDTSQIGATMPDSTLVKMVHERSTNVWHGLWQVPIGFKSGSYYAKLSAVDLEGNLFEGQSSPFTIGELAMVMLVGRVATKEAAERQAEAKRLAAEADILAAEAGDKAARARALLSGEAAGEQRVQMAIKPVVRMPAVKKRGPVVAVRPRPKTAGSDGVFKARFATVARFYLEKMEYKKVKTQLQAMLKIDPRNKEMRSMLGRVDKLIKAKEVSK